MGKQEKNLRLVKEGEFLGTKCDFYKDDDDNIYMTRMQIGKALQYKNPDDGIYRIHERNKDRLDHFSVVVKLSSTDGKQYDTRLYIERGIYDICRFSRQPVADDFYDWVYDQIALIRKTGGAIDNKDLFIQTYCTGMNEAQKIFIKGFMTKIEEQQGQINQMQPHVDDWTAFMDSKGNLTMSKVAKALNIDGIGRNNLFAILRNRSILQSNNEPYQRYVNAGYFKVVTTEKRGHKYTQTLVTGKGMSFINKKMKEWGYAS